jgi:hypothetical protein
MRLNAALKAPFEGTSVVSAEEGFAHAMGGVQGRVPRSLRGKRRCP